MLNVSLSEHDRGAMPVVSPGNQIGYPMPGGSKSFVHGVGVHRGIRPRRGLRLNTAVCFGVSVLVLAFTILAGRLDAPAPLVGCLAIGGAVTFCLSILIALGRAMLGVVRLIWAPQGDTTVGVGGTVGGILGNALMAGLGTYVAYFATVGFARGRQLRRFGRVQLPSLRSSASWTTALVALDGHDCPPTGLAEQWRENGKTEHASVAAFARLTLDLMALGAPPTLIAAANEDALDEIRHAELCFSLACALDGKSVGPASFPEAQRVAQLPHLRALALGKLAVDSLVDGALHEGVSARIIAKLARRCDVPEIRAALKEIAADEGRHAAHGWAVVEWCLDEGGAAVSQAVLSATQALPRRMRSQLPEAASDGGWERWGIHGEDLEAEEYEAALAHVIRRARSTAARRLSAA